MKKTFYLTAALFAALFVGCISEYEPGGLEEMDNILVVEGIITDGTSTINLSRSMTLNDGSTTNPKVSTADVSIICDDGTVFTATDPVVDGTYNIDVTLAPDKKYRVRIVAGGQEYESDFRTPQSTPEIDDINYYKAATGDPVQMRVSTTGRDGASRFFLWSFEEIWEITSPIAATVYQDIYGEYRQVGDGEYYPYYYCWQYAISSGLMIGSSAKQTENVLKDYTVAEFEAMGDRFKIMYWVQLRQNMISEDAYEYFSTLKKNAESSGGIFTAIISEMKGNIACTTDPSIPVIGFVDVSYTTTGETFVDPSQQLAEYSTINTCYTYSSVEAAETAGYERKNLSVSWIDPYPMFPPPDTLWAPTKCIDCRKLGGGGTKTKPDFWPTIHE